MSYQPPALDADLASPDWQAIEQLLDELAMLARQQDLAPSAFYRVLLDRLTAAVHAASSTVWVTGRDGSPRLAHYAVSNAAGGELARELTLQRAEVVVAALRESAARTAGPFSARATKSWHGVHPVANEGPRGECLALEVLLPGEPTPAATRALLQVLTAVSEVAEDFERRAELRSLRASAAAWRDYDQFSQQVHHSLDIERTAFAIANEARRVVDCDRVSVLEVRGKAARVLAVSGVDTVDRRSQAVRALEQFARRACAYGEPIWYHDGAADLADELVAPLETYLEQSESRVVAVVPLHSQLPEEHDAPAHQAADVIGLLVAEHFQGTTLPDVFRDRLMVLASHAGLALQHARSHSRMPLARLSRALGRAGWLTSSRQLPKTALVALVAGAIIGSLVFVPADFRVEAPGELQPKVRREVYASDDGVVAELLVSAGQAVQADEPLIQLRKPDLDLELRRVLGELETAQKQLASVRAERLQDAPASQEQRRRDPHELAAEEAEVQAKLAGLQAQQAILESQLAALVIRSPIAGQTLTWNAQQLLAARPVERGQTLLSVADLDGPWELRLRVPDDRAGYVAKAREELGPVLDVEFVLTSDPNRSITGTLTDLALTTELDARQESAVAGTVAFDRSAFPALRPGTTAVAKIYCGRRSLGFVWFHDLFNYLRSWWW